MRDTRTVCLLCRSVAAGTRRPSAAIPRPPWTPAAAAAALTTRSSSSPVVAPQSSQRHDDDARDARTPRQPRRLRQSPVGGSESKSSSMAIFESVVRRQRQDQGQVDTHRHSQDGLKPPKLDLQTYNDVAKLMEMLEETKRPIFDTYRFFIREIYPNLIAARYVPEVFRPELRRLLQDLLVAMAKDPTSPDLPMLAHVTLVALKLGLLDIRRWAAAMQGRLQHLCLSSISPDVPTDQYQTAIGRARLLLDDVTQSWKLFTLPHHVVAELDALVVPSEAAFRLPEWQHLQGDSNALYYLICKLLHHKYAPLQLRPVVPLVLVTFVLFNDPARCLPGTRASASPFLAPVAGLIARARDAELGPDKLMDLPPQLAPYLMERWGPILRQLRQTGSPALQSKKRPIAIKKLDVAGSDRRPAGDILKTLNKALSDKNHAILERAWLDFYGHDPQPPPATLHELRKHRGLWNQFIMAFTALRMPQRAMQVWAAMVDVGVQADVKTYTAMMEGCKRARNVAGLENVWHQMASLRVPLDVHAWTVRISGLVECGRPEAGLQALDEMAQRWRDRNSEPAADHRNTAVQPSIAPVNAALTGLLRLNGVPAAMKLLEWADGHGISPDIYTYNTLLQTMIRRAPDQVEAVLDMMREQGVSPDDGTDTIIIEGMGPYLRSATADEKLEAVKRILSMVAGRRHHHHHHHPQNQHQHQHQHIRDTADPAAKVNVAAYAKLMFELLRGETGDSVDVAINHILHQMWTRGLEPTTHMYTILVEHYFHRAPPALDRVHALIDTHALADKPHMDQIFWERVIAGFLDAADVASAAAVFARLKYSGLLTMRLHERLLRALVAQGRMDDAARLVAAVREAKLSAEEGQQRFMYHSFWDVARECGLYH